MLPCGVRRCHGAARPHSALTQPRVMGTDRALGHPCRVPMLRAGCGQGRDMVPSGRVHGVSPRGCDSWALPARCCLIRAQGWVRPSIPYAHPGSPSPTPERQLLDSARCQSGHDGTRGPGRQGDAATPCPHCSTHTHAPAHPGHTVAPIPIPIPYPRHSKAGMAQAGSCPAWSMLGSAQAAPSTWHPARSCPRQAHWHQSTAGDTGAHLAPCAHGWQSGKARVWQWHRRKEMWGAGGAALRPGSTHRGLATPVGTSWQCPPCST